MTAQQYRIEVWPTVYIAGIIGGAAFELYLFLFFHLNPIQHWTFIATVVLGPAIGPKYVWFGALVHYGVSIIWAMIYAMFAQLWPALVRAPWLWGPLYGVVVMAGMTLVLMAKHVGAPPSGLMLVLSLAGHCVFFGLPLALYISFAAER